MKFYLNLIGTPYHIFTRKDWHASLIKLTITYNLRNTLTFNLTHSYWKGHNDSFTHRASIIWNVLPVKIKSSPSLGWLVGSVVGWFGVVRWFVRWFVGSFVGSLVRSLVRWLVRWLVALYVGWFVCWIICLEGGTNGLSPL